MSSATVSTRRNARAFHYFGCEFDEASFGRFFLDPKAFGEKLAYLGFTVVKPLPETMIGRTCIVPPAETECIAFPYEPNLFGTDLKVLSLPFQEQDKEVAACATNALWTMLHGTAQVFEHTVLTPLQITRSALAHSPLIRRTLPNEGLDISQIAAVIRGIGWKPS